MLRNARAAEKDTLAWMWKRGEATAREDFGDPLSATTYRVCLYANQQLVYAATVAAGGTCGAKPCWGTTKRGFAYADRAGAAGGLVRVRLDAGAVGKARIIATARGSQLTLPSLPLALPVDIRLHGAGTTCFGAVYDRARKNTATAFRGG